jgi:Flp pilus assembly protein TadD
MEFSSSPACQVSRHSAGFTAMADKDVPGLPPPTSEDLRIAAGHFDYAHRATTIGNHDIAINMLRTCCRLVPANLAYRQALRKVEKTKYKDNRRGSFLAPLTTWRSKLKLWKAHRRNNHLKVLEYGEAVLARNPWERDTQLCMAEAAAALRQNVLAIWILQEAREQAPNDIHLNRALARLLEKEGRFTTAMHLWELVRKKLPTDREATAKSKQMAVSDTLARGNYEEAVGTEPGGSAKVKTGKGSSNNFLVPPAIKSGAVREAEVLRTRIASEPGNPEPYLLLAALEKRHGRLKEARAVLEEGLAATGQAAALALELADLEIESYRRMLIECEEKLKAAPQDEKLVKTRKKLVHKINSLEVDLFRQKIQQNPSDTSLSYEFGKRLFRAGNIEEAIPHLQNARADARLYWKAVLYLGHCFATREQWPLAQRNFEEALRKMPEGEREHRKEVLFLLARGYAEAGELQRAVEMGIDLADMDYSYRNIGPLLEEWQRRMQEARGSAKAH